MTGALVLLAVVLFVVQIRSSLGSTQDDAFISYRYARNLASGEGFVFNPGEPVEGYTNFLWTLLLAGVIAVGGDPVVLAPWLGAAAAAALIVLLRFGAGTAGLAGAAATVLFAVGSAVAAEAVQGLETPLFALLVTGAILMDARERESGRAIGNGGSGWLYALAALTRPEGLAVFAVAAGLRAATLAAGRRADGPRIDPRGEAAWIARALLPVAGHLVFRFVYYGDLVPNTFHAKVGLSAAVLARGARYVGEFAVAYLPVLALALAGLVAERRRARAHLIALWSVVHVAYVACVGGDYKPTYRFFAPVIPLLCLMAGIGLEWLARASSEVRPRATLAILGGAGISVAAWTLVHLKGPGAGTGREGKPFVLLVPFLCLIAAIAVPLVLRFSPNTRPLRAYAIGAGACMASAAMLWVDSASAREFTAWRRSVLPIHEAAGRWLGWRYPPGTLLATINAGVLPYYSDLPTIDMLGLCDRAIARRDMPFAGAGMAGHEKGDGAYVLSRAPDIILFMWPRFSPGPIPESEAGRHAFGVSENELWADGAFHRAYRWTSVSLSGFTFNYYERRAPRTPLPGPG